MSKQSKSPIRAAWRWLRFLVSCLRVLGLRNGCRYWCAVNWAFRKPERVLNWANDCEAEADKIEATDSKRAWCFRHWAKRLREAYSANENQTEQEPPNEDNQ